MNSLELKIPPVIVVLITALLIWLVSLVLPEPPGFESSIRSVLSSIIFVTGILLICAALVSFYRFRTSIDPVNPDKASVIVTSGVYSVTRNPMYLAMLLILTAQVVYLWQPAGVLMLILYVAYITRFQIIPEERMLEIKFGNEFQNYQNKVRRWI